MFAQQQLASSRVRGALGAVGREQVAGEDEIVRKALVRVEIELQVLLRPVGVDIAEVLLEAGTLEDVDNLARELIEGVLAALAEIEARELVIERAVAEAGDGALVDVLLLRGEIVLLQETGETFIEQRVVGVAVQFTAEHDECGGNLAREGEAAKVAIQHLRIGCGSFAGCGRVYGSIE